MGGDGGARGGDWGQWEARGCERVRVGARGGDGGRWGASGGAMGAIRQFRDNLMLAAKGPSPQSTMYPVCMAMEDIWNLRVLCPCRDKNPDALCQGSCMTNRVRAWVSPSLCHRREHLATPTPMPSMISDLSNSVRPCKVTGPCPCLAPPMSSSQRSPTPSLLCDLGARSCCPVRLGCNLLCYLGTCQWQCARLCPRQYTGFWLKLSGMCRAPFDGSFFCLPACLSRSSTLWVTCSRGSPDPPSGTGLLTPPGT